MKYLVIFLVLFGFMMILSVNNIYAMPPFHSQEIYDFSNVIVVGKVISVNSTFSPTHNLYEIQVEKFLKNPQDLDVLFAAGQKTANIRLGNQVFDVNDRGLFYLINNTIGYDPYFGIFGVYPTSQLIEPEWDKCNIFEKEITREHWFLGGGGITPKIQQGTNSDIENFNKDKPVTVTYDVSNLSDSVQEFDLDGTLVSHVTASKVMATMNQHIILEPCTIYNTIDWEFTPSMTGFYNFEIKDSRSGSYGLGFTVVDNDSTVIKSPLKQIKSGVALVDVQCKDGKVSAVRYDRMRVACVSLDTEGKLMMRGWATMRLAMPGDNISHALCNNYEGKWHQEYFGCRDITDFQCSLMGGELVDNLSICYNGICPDKLYSLCVTNPNLYIQYLDETEDDFRNRCGPSDTLRGPTPMPTECNSELIECTYVCGDTKRWLFFDEHGFEIDQTTAGMIVDRK